MSDPRLIQDSMLGCKFAERRRALGLSREDVARISGVHRNTVYRLEMGYDIHYRSIEYIAVALGAQVTVDLIVDCTKGCEPYCVSP